MNESYEFGRHIVIWGATGSGKSTLARELGNELGLHVVELDAIKHSRGWESVPTDEFRERLTLVLEDHSDGWICEGSYRAVMDVYLSRADTLIWLNLPWRMSFWRLFKRTITRAIDQKPLYEGSHAHETWRQSFASRNSILLWSWTTRHGTPRKFKERIAELPSAVRVHEAKSAREVNALLEAAQHQAVRS